jgi:hypothetical protein
VRKRTILVVLGFEVHPAGGDIGNAAKPFPATRFDPDRLNRLLPLQTPAMTIWQNALPGEAFQPFLPGTPRQCWGFASRRYQNFFQNLTKYEAPFKPNCTES